MTPNRPSKLLKAKKNENSENNHKRNFYGVRLLKKCKEDRQLKETSENQLIKAKC